MRSSTLLAGLFALLIVAGVSFGAGYYMAKDSGNEPRDSKPIAALDAATEQPDDEGDPLDSPERDTPEPEDKPDVLPDVTPKPDSTPGPTPENPGDVEATTPNESSDPSTIPSAELPAEVKDALGDVNNLKDLANRLKDAGLEDPENFENIFNGPKVDFTATIGGQALDALGVPVAGASVHANFSENYSSDEGGRSVRLVMAVGEDKGSVVATTDGGGYWTATINRKVSEKASLNVSLVASADGYADSEKKTVTLKNEDNKEGIKLTLRGAGSVSGRVVNAHGMGVEGVTVSLRTGGNGFFGGDEIEIDFGGSGGKHSAVTDGAGEFLIEGVPEGRYKFKLSGTGYRQISGPTEIDVKSGQSHRAPADFQVAVTGSLVAKFTDLEGNPVRGWATLTIKDGDGKVVKRLSGSINEEGVFEKNDPAVGNYDVEIRVYGYKTQTVQANFLEGQRYDFGTLVLEKDETAGGSGGIWLPEDDE